MSKSKDFSGKLLKKVYNILESYGLNVKLHSESYPPWVSKDAVTHGGGFINMELTKEKELLLMDGTDIDAVSARMRTHDQTGTHSGTATYQYLVKKDPSNAPKAFKAKIKKEKKGIVNRETVGLTWKGYRLAKKLNSNKKLEKLLLDEIDPHEKIKIKPDEKYRCVRIIHSGNVKIESILKGIKIDKEKSTIPSKRIIKGFDRIGKYIKNTY